MTTVSPSNPCPDSPNINESPLTPQHSPLQHSDIQALMDLAAAQQMPAHQSSPPNLPEVPSTYSKLLEILTKAIKSIYS